MKDILEVKKQMKIHLKQIFFQKIKDLVRNAQNQPILKELKTMQMKIKVHSITNPISTANTNVTFPSLKASCDSSNKYLQLSKKNKNTSKNCSPKIPNYLLIVSDALVFCTRPFPKMLLFQHDLCFNLIRNSKNKLNQRKKKKIRKCKNNVNKYSIR